MIEFINILSLTTNDIIGICGGALSILSIIIAILSVPKLRNFIFRSNWRKQYIEDNISKNSFRDETDRRNGDNIYVQPRLVEQPPQPNGTKDHKQIGTLLNDYFIQKVFKKDYRGDQVFLILADTGMGKSTALVNLTIDYVRTYNTFTLPYEIKLLSLHEKNIFDSIREIPNKQKHILLLDALDENVEAQGHNTYDSFLTQLEAIYQQFAFVVMTCRPQFFSMDKEEFDVANVRLNQDFARCKKLYLDYFDKHQVQEYLDQKPTFSHNSPERTKAENIIAKCPDIAMRPLVLSYIDILVGTGKGYNTSREIYDAIVKELIAREVKNVFSRDREKHERQWLELSSEVAGFMYRSHPLQPTITEAEIEDIVNEYNENLSDEEKVDVQTFRDRSLLTRDGTERRFSHKSFYEFLMAYRFFLNYDEIDSLQGMDFAVQIFNELSDDYCEGRGDGLMFIQQVPEADAARAMSTIGAELSDLNQFNGAKKAYSKALETFRRLAKANPAAYDLDVAMTLNNMGNLHYKTNDYAHAAEKFAEALEIFRQQSATHPTYEPLVADTLNNMGNCHMEINDYAQAAEEYVEAWEIYHRLDAAYPTAYDPYVATTLDNMGKLCLKMDGSAPATAEKLTEFLKIYRRLSTADPAAYEPKVAQTLNKLGTCHMETNEYVQAAEEYVEAWKIYRRLAKANPTAYEPYVAQTLDNMGILRRMMDGYAPATAEKLTEFLKIYRRLSTADPAAYEPYVAMTLHSLGNFHLNTHNYAYAAKEYAEALEILRRLAKADPAAYELYVASTLNNLGNHHINTNDYTKSMEELAEALDIYRRLAKANPAAYEPDMAKTLNNLGALHINTNDYAKSTEELAEALDIYRRLAKANPAAYEPYVANTLNRLGPLHHKTNDYAHATKEYAEALEIYRQLAKANPTAYEPDMALTLNSLGVLHINTNDYAKSTEELAKALEICRRLAKANPAAYEPEVALTLFNLALLHTAQGNYSKAEAYAQESLDIYRRFAEISHAAFDSQVKASEMLLSLIREAIENDN